MAHIKTNAMRILDHAGVVYTHHSYESNGFVDGVSVAAKIGKNQAQVYKTLVAKGASRTHYVFIIPVAEELDLKAAAKTVGEKSVEMIKVTDITKITGYIRGGCSPIGMKKLYRTVIDETCTAYDTIIVSAGKIGMQLELNPADLIRVVPCEVAAITMPH